MKILTISTEEIDKITGNKKNTPILDMNTLTKLFVVVNDVVLNYEYRRLYKNANESSYIHVTFTERSKKIHITYQALSDKNGILTIVDEENNKRKTQKVTLEKGKSCLKDAIKNSHANFNRVYFSKSKLVQKLFSYSKYAVYASSLIGYLFFFLEDFRFYDDHINELKIVYILSFVFVLLFLIYVNKQDYKSNWKASLNVLCLSLVFSFGLAQGGLTAVHFFTAKPNMVAMTITGKNAAYEQSKVTTCEGGVYLKELLSPVCMKSKAYWMRVNDTMKVLITGEISPVGIEIKTIEYQ